MRALYSGRRAARYRSIFMSLIKILSANRGTWNGLAVQHVWFFGAGGESARLTSNPTDGGLKVDLALRLNVLAVCAAIVFVGAILFGAF